MTNVKMFKSGFIAAALATAFATTSLATAPAAAAAAAETGSVVVLSIGRGQQLNLPTAITDVVVADPAIADVEVKSARQIYLLAKGPGETTIYATDAKGNTVFRAIVRVGQNLDSLDQMLKLAMPDANITITTMNGSVLLTGTVAQPEDAEEAQRLVQAFAGPNTQVIGRLKNATPLQVNLRVRIAEVSRSLAKEISGNINTWDTTSNPNGSLYNIGTGSRNFVTKTDVAGGGTTFTFNRPAGINSIGAIGKLFGLDVAAAFDLAERNGLIATLAEPNLTTISGETAEFRSGGQYPFPVSSGLGATSVEFKNFGISLQYTPTVLSNGRIQLRVHPEVSEISSQGAVRIGGIEVPAITQRMADTTVELGSGQSFMIAGLLQNTSSSSVDKVPGAGDLPVLGALFKSNGWRRNETELMIIVTPYLVKPVSDSEIKLPTDGFNTPNDLERVLLGKVASSKGDGNRPMPSVAGESNGPDMSSVSQDAPKLSKTAPSQKAQASAPGFSFDQ
jgi:pilus assembly protein CpaC